MKQVQDVTRPQRQALAIATVIALLFGAYFLRHYFTLIIFAAILAFLFKPMYDKRVAKSKNPGRSAATTFVSALFIILVPLAIVSALTVMQVNHSIKNINTNVNSSSVTELSQHLIDSANRVLAKTPSDFRVTSEWVHDEAADLAKKVGTAFVNNITTYAGNFFSFFTTSIIFIFVFLSLLKNQGTLLKMIKQLNPLGDEISDLYVRRISAMTKAMVRGQFIIAIAQGFTDATLLYIAGLHEAYFFFFMILTALSFIPLGGGILAIPIGIGMILTGNITGGLIVIIGHLIIVTNIDNVLRPKLVPAEARLDSALTILSVFSGIALLGFLGIVVGPVIMITIVTTISVYLEVFRDVDMKDNEAATKKKNYWQRIFGRRHATK